MTKQHKQQSSSRHPALVWYVCYGSNLNDERFDYYLHGGTMPANGQTYPGCRDKTPPRETKEVTLHHQLYFGGSTNIWHGGVAFIDPKPSSDAATRAFGYLITMDQFVDIVKQENGLDHIPDLSLEMIRAKGSSILKKFGLYSEVMYLGDIDGSPALTFTAQTKQKFSRPSEAYLSQIAIGLHHTHHLTSSEIADYLKNIPGVKKQYSAKELMSLPR